MGIVAKTRVHFASFVLFGIVGYPSALFEFKSSSVTTSPDVNFTTWNSVVLKVLFSFSARLKACPLLLNDTFLYFGHDPKLISVLDGDFKKWINEERPTSKKITNI